ncbi:hypothetical protein [Clostridium sp. BNL1100]|uniref:hypothetical protein n=1 Tax=Clostridium sp. BNL1100 TaxID=755731 RepID=UPI00024A7A9F|nr:hypothetical protein [Clostridium sp. BNL1100]AEY66615.1 hypothetical protein Clo1100_2444 [Clostridium sp. BNL1100]
MLNKQFKMYSVDTRVFYTSKEQRINKTLSDLKKIKYGIMNFTLYEIVNKDNMKMKYTRWQDVIKLKSYDKKRFNQFINKNKHLRNASMYKNALKNNIFYQEIETKIKKAEKDLITIINKIKNNNRVLTKELTDYNTISVFEGSLSRILELGKNNLTDKVVVIKIVDGHEQSIMKSIIDNGFIWNRERYITLTSSAGQIRKHKILFIKESIWNQYKGKIQCGLDIKDMNESEYNGCNINKMLSYLALQLSATDVWESFDIDRCIVCDDLETVVKGTVDYISKDLEVTPNVKNKEILINQIDGCGMISSELSDKNFMVRLPWVKGLLGVWNIKRWCKSENGGNYMVKDIFGSEFDVLKDNIQIIFSKSQFKMWKYYKAIAEKYNAENGTALTGWDMYKKLFKKYGCEASKCNVEENIKTRKDKYYYKKATYGYQMLQTITDITDTELQELTQPTVDLITKAHTKIDAMLQVLGYDEDSNLAMCVEKYPSIMRDSWVKERLESKLTSIRKSTKVAKLRIDGTYTFVVPDLYAYCEFIFKGKKNPKGILGAKEVHCRMFPQKEILLNRSPSLYKEHWITNNRQRKEHRDWFTTNAVYVNIHDLASKVLMYDCDGDKLLVIGQNNLITIAKRNMQGINPLFYEMGVAGSQVINNENIYKSLTYAYKVGNVGKYSNKMTQIWNEYPEADVETKKVLLKKAKILTALNNFAIDSAKSLDFVKINKSMKTFLKSKKEMPYFFKFAKDYDGGKCLGRGNGTVDRIAKIIEGIPYTNFNFDNISRFNYRKLMKNSKIEIDSKVIEIYEKYVNLQQQAYKNNSYQIQELDEREVARLSKQSLLVDFAKEVTALGIEVYFAVDVIIKYVFTKKSENGKSFLFDILGGYVYDNLCENIKSNLTGKVRKTDNLSQCSSCGEGFEKTSNRQKLCPRCAKEKIRESDRLRKKKIS